MQTNVIRASPISAYWTLIYRLETPNTETGINTRATHVINFQTSSTDQSRALISLKTAEPSLIGSLNNMMEIVLRYFLQEKCYFGKKTSDVLDTNFAVVD